MTKNPVIGAILLFALVFLFWFAFFRAMESCIGYEPRVVPRPALEGK